MANRLLTIEDDPDIRLMLKMVLEDEGWLVSEAANGAEGLERFAEDQPDLVLVDLKLPDRSGFEVCRSLRQTSGVPIIIVTAQESSFDVVAGLEAGPTTTSPSPSSPRSSRPGSGPCCAGPRAWPPSRPAQRPARHRP